MPGQKALSITDSPERLLNLLYNAGFRLTGNHRDAAELVRCAAVLYGGNGKGGPTAILRCLYTVFTEKYKNTGVLQFPGSSRGRDGSDHSTERIQAALLSLPPGERVMVVLRDMLGLDYAEIAVVTGLEKIEVARSLAAARGTLRNRVVLSSYNCPSTMAGPDKIQVPAQEQEHQPVNSK